MELVSSKVDLDKDTSLLVPSPGQSCYHKRGGHLRQQQDEHSSFIRCWHQFGWKERDGSCERLRKCDLGGGQRVNQWQEVSVPALQPEGGFWTSAERRSCKQWWEKKCSLPKVATRNFTFWFILLSPRTERNKVHLVQCCTVQADHRAASFRRLWVCPLQSINIDLFDRTGLSPNPWQLLRTRIRTTYKQPSSSSSSSRWWSCLFI